MCPMYPGLQLNCRSVHRSQHATQQVVRFVEQDSGDLNAYLDPTARPGLSNRKVYGLVRPVVQEKLPFESLVIDPPDFTAKLRRNQGREVFVLDLEHSGGPWLLLASPRVLSRHHGDVLVS